MPNVGPLEIAVVLIIVLIIFGPKRLPELGQSMGRGIREFRSSLSGDKDKDQDSPDEKPRELEASQQAQASQPQPTQAQQPGQPAPAAPAPPASPAEKPAEPVEGEIVTENKA
ncbi:MAG: twin-arginine translocase TatA/TatE family subunit [Solirubrobacterales bacterium]